MDISRYLEAMSKFAMCLIPGADGVFFEFEQCTGCHCVMRAWVIVTKYQSVWFKYPIDMREVHHGRRR